MCSNHPATGFETAGHKSTIHKHEIFPAQSVTQIVCALNICRSIFLSLMIKIHIRAFLWGQLHAYSINEGQEVTVVLA